MSTPRPLPLTTNAGDTGADTANADSDADSDSDTDADSDADADADADSDADVDDATDAVRTNGDSESTITRADSSAAEVPLKPKPMAGQQPRSVPRVTDCQEAI